MKVWMRSLKATKYYRSPLHFNQFLAAIFEYLVLEWSRCKFDVRQSKHCHPQTGQNKRGNTRISDSKEGKFLTTTIIPKDYEYDSATGVALADLFVALNSILARVEGILRI
ncbi:hypothetical protein J6590_104350 [Homalodisca vitripennis]|nr:hypothetical protein J6590_104350 [Homalodisca vitripennis]